ncbi:hypothetical protein OUZ56_011633 [Daphnia magna]|uniref:Uncharacterized protein n=1 Tax=Daphnia magna TaxID=35525 RepID=A0ABQ9Z0R9_9CRUS|nr:hypothetical protein OUZ56_011633 [Daphnia magna]
MGPTYPTTTANLPRYRSIISNKKIARESCLTELSFTTFRYQPPLSQDFIIERVVYFTKANEDILSITEKKPHLKESPFMSCAGSLKNLFQHCM